MKPLRQNILEALEELKKIDLESEQARQIVADRIISKRTKEIIDAFKNANEFFNELDSELPKALV